MTPVAALRQGARRLVQQPGFSLFALLTLSIGIAAGTTLFSAVDALLLAPVPGLRDADRLVEIGSSTEGRSRDAFSAPDYADLAASAKDVADLVAFRYETMNLATGVEPQRTMGVVVSGNYFGMLGVSAQGGRLLEPQDDRQGAAPVVVASFAAWRKFFAGDPAVIGKPVSINGQSFTLVGVSAPEFRGTLTLLTPMFFVPLHQLGLLQPAAGERLDQRATRWLTLIGRLASGANAASAAQRLTLAAADLEKLHPRDAHAGEIAVQLVPLRGVPAFLRGGVTAFSALLFALTGVLLLLACVNVASMLLARGEARRPEIALRYVLGATRRRVVAGLIGENLLLSLAAATVGYALGVVGCRALAQADLPTPVPISIAIPVATGALYFAVACALFCTLAIGLLPALRVSATAPAANEALAASRSGGGRSRLGASLIVMQIALTTLLLAGGAMFLHALQRAASIDIGYDVRPVAAAEFDLEPGGYAVPRQHQLQDEVLARLRATDGIDAAALARIVPFNLDRLSFGSFQVGATSFEPFGNLVSPGFFAALGTPLQGRDFDAHDTADRPPVGIVNAALARRLAPDGDVLGRSFSFGEEGATPQRLTVIGIAPSGRYGSLGDADEPFLFMPLAQSPRAEAQTSVIVRSALPADALAQRLHTVWRGLDASLPAPAVRPLEQILGLSLLPQKVAGLVSSGLGLIGLLLAAIGLYGLVSIQVARRTREFGVRLALGATPAGILRDVIGRGARLSAFGLGLGAVLTGAAAVAIEGLLFGFDLGSLAACALVACVLAATALLASWLPARRAARIQPVEALRYE